MELPDVCCQHAREPETWHKVVPELWQLAQVVAGGSAGELCDPQVAPSHACPQFHPSSTTPLVAFEAHFAPAYELLHLNACRTPTCQAQHQRDLASAAADAWEPVISQALGEDSIIEAVDGYLLVYVPTGKLEDAVRRVALQPLIASVTPARVHVLHDLRQVSLLMQSTQREVASDTDLQYWAAGLNGQGQVIGLGDGGMDMQHCAFSDPDIAFDNFKVGDERIPYFESEDHRKVSLYFMCDPPTAGSCSSLSGPLEI